jgi:two-component system, NtrC family, sensor kinase
LANAIDTLDESFTVRHASSANRKQPTAQPQITIRTSTIGSGWIQIAIIDNGAGMTETTRQHIFNPFFTTKPIGKGTGMGMSISHQIITKKHGGKLECNSTLGKGTEFLIQIPIRQP